MAASPPIVGAARGRGARSNHTGRYESAQGEDFHDGWTEDDGEPVCIETTLTAETARKIITRNASPDIGFDQSINAYRGCEHGWPYLPVTHS